MKLVSLRPIGAAFAALAFILCTWCLPASAASNNLLLIGGQVSPNGDSGYLGTLVPFAGGRLGSGWFIRPWTEYNTYSYVGYPGVVNARVPGGSLGFGYAWSGSGWARSLSVAPGWQDTRLTPYDPHATNRGSQAFLLIQGELSQNFTHRFWANVIANYSVGPDQYWSRVRLGYSFTSLFSFGPEGVFQGGSDYHIWQAGLFAGWSIGKEVKLDTAAGFLKSSGVARVGYVSLGLTVLY